MKKKQLLGGWAPRDTAKQLQRVARHSSIVAMSKYGLTGLALLLVVAVFIIPALFDTDDGARLVFTNIQTGESLKPRMMAPRFQGLDGKQQPHNLNAEYAERQDDGAFYLNTIDADITLDSGMWITMLADDGIYNPEKKTLFLPNKVNILQDEGYEIRTEEVHADLEKAEAYGQKHIEGQGPTGTLDADGFRYDGNKRILHFSPNVVVRLYPNQGDDEKK